MVRFKSDETHNPHEGTTRVGLDGERPELLVVVVVLSSRISNGLGIRCPVAATHTIVGDACNYWLGIAA